MGENPPKEARGARRHSQIMPEDTHPTPAHDKGVQEGGADPIATFAKTPWDLSFVHVEPPATCEAGMPVASLGPRYDTLSLRSYTPARFAHVVLTLEHGASMPCTQQQKNGLWGALPIGL